MVRWCFKRDLDIMILKNGLGEIRPEASVLSDITKMRGQEGYILIYGYCRKEKHDDNR